MKYGVLVKALRVRKGWSQEEFAEKLFMSRSAISKLENDQQTLDVPTLHRICQVTGEPIVAAAIMLGTEGINAALQLLQIMGVGVALMLLRLIGVG